MFLRNNRTKMGMLVATFFLMLTLNVRSAMAQSEGGAGYSINVVHTAAAAAGDAVAVDSDYQSETPAYWQFFLGVLIITGFVLYQVRRPDHRPRHHS